MPVTKSSAPASTKKPFLTFPLKSFQGLTLERGTHFVESKPWKETDPEMHLDHSLHSFLQDPSNGDQSQELPLSIIWESQILRYNLGNEGAIVLFLLWWFYQIVPAKKQKMKIILDSQQVLTCVSPEVDSCHPAPNSWVQVLLSPWQEHGRKSDPEEVDPMQDKQSLKHTNPWSRDAWTAQKFFGQYSPVLQSRNTVTCVDCILCIYNIHVLVFYFD